MEEEIATDEKLRAQFKEKWTRTSSEKLTETMRAESDKYKYAI